MTLWGDMVRCAARGARRLGAEAGSAAEFLLAQRGPGGGLCNRAGREDLYYTGLGETALRAVAGSGGLLIGTDEGERLAEYLLSFRGGERLDLIHLSCLVRSWVCAGGVCEDERLTRAVREWCSADGGFAQGKGQATGTLYGCFLAVGALQDCGADLDAAAVARCVLACRAEGGGFSNSAGESMGLAPATAGAIQVLHALGQPMERAWGEWLIDRCFSGGGFLAHEISPEPDLLSTAVSLHALELAGATMSREPLRECEAFVRGLRQGGGFRGAASDALADCEYTFYGLLALGHFGDGDPD